MPRQKSVTDAQIFAATLQAIGRFGHSKLTLSNVSSQIGMAPATLIQRFGTKRALLLAAIRHGLETSKDQFTEARRKHTSPLEALLGTLVEGSALFAVSPEELANHLAFLQMDLTDPEFYEATLKQARDTHFQIRELLDEAVEAGELVPGDTERLARAVHDVYTGAVLNWAVFRDGAVEDRVLESLATLLSPLRVARRRSVNRATMGA